MAEVLEQDGRNAEAVQVCEEALAIDQKHAKVNHHLGKFHLKGGNLERAELHLRHAFDSGEAQSLVDLGEAFQQRGELDKAKRCFWDVHNCGFSGDGSDSWTKHTAPKPLLGLLLQRRCSRGFSQACSHQQP